MWRLRCVESAANLFVRVCTERKLGYCKYYCYLMLFFFIIFFGYVEYQNCYDCVVNVFVFDMESTPSAFLRVQCNGMLFWYGFGMESIIIIIAVDGMNGYVQPCCESKHVEIHLDARIQVDL